MHAAIRLMSTHFMVGRPGSEAGSLYYGKNKPLSAEGESAATLQLEFKTIANKWHHKSCTKGDNNELNSKTTCNCWSELPVVFSEQALKEAYEAIWRILGEDWPSIIGRKLPSSRRPGQL